MLLDKNYTFIDLFAGIGGFHCAMKNYSKKSRCLLASEINEQAKLVYEKNFGMKVFGDIKKVNKNDIKGKVDVVCGGFPCQTFSKAGMQKGFGDPRGTLFKEIIKLIEDSNIENQPKILILENVRNLINHDNGVTWNTIRKELERVNYNVIKTPLVVSPKDYNIAQLRDRAIILAVRKDIYNGPIALDIPKKPNNSNYIYKQIRNIKLSEEENKKYHISPHIEEVLDAWNAFVKGLKLGIVGFPIWSDEFGKNYDISKYPEWKQNIITKNRNFYDKNKEFIDKWLDEYKIKSFIPTYRKFEWQVNGKINDIYQGLIQLRPSGIRVKRATESPTLVAMVHVPILGKYKRYLTPKEMAKLQSFPVNYDFSMERDYEAYKQLGNAVNVKVICNVFELFIKFIENKIKEGGNNK